MKEKAGYFLNEAALIGAGSAPVALGAALAWRESGAYDLPAFAVSMMLGAFLVLAAAYSTAGRKDVKGELNEKLNDKLVYIKDTRRRMLFLALALFSIAFLIYVAGLTLALIGVALIFLSYIYMTGFVFRSSGFGVLAMAYIFIVLLVFTGYYVQTKIFSFIPVFVGMSQAFLFTAIIYAKDLKSYEYDQTQGRKTLPLFMGSMGKKWAYYGQIENYIDSYVILFILVLLDVLPLFALLPLALILIMTDNIRQLIKAAKGEEGLLAKIARDTAVFYLLFSLLLIMGIITDRIITGR